MFLDSLEDSEKQVAKKARPAGDSKTRLQKNLRNQQNRVKNKRGAPQSQVNNPRDPPQDLSVYMPVHRRSGAAAAAGALSPGAKHCIGLLTICIDLFQEAGVAATSQGSAEAPSDR